MVAEQALRCRHQQCSFARLRGTSRLRRGTSLPPHRPSLHSRAGATLHSRVGDGGDSRQGKGHFSPGAGSEHAPPLRSASPGEAGRAFGAITSERGKAREVVAEQAPSPCGASADDVLRGSKHYSLASPKGVSPGGCS